MATATVEINLYEGIALFIAVVVVLGLISWGIFTFLCWLNPAHKPED